MNFLFVSFIVFVSCRFQFYQQIDDNFKYRGHVNQYTNPEDSSVAKRRQLSAMIGTTLPGVYETNPVGQGDRKSKSQRMRMFAKFYGTIRY